MGFVAQHSSPLRIRTRESSESLGGSDSATLRHCDSATLPHCYTATLRHSDTVILRECAITAIALTRFKDPAVRRSTPKTIAHILYLSPFPCLKGLFRFISLRQLPMSDLSPTLRSSVVSSIGLRMQSSSIVRPPRKTRKLAYIKCYRCRKDKKKVRC